MKRCVKVGCVVSLRIKFELLPKKSGYIPRSITPLHLCRMYPMSSIVHEMLNL